MTLSIQAKSLVRFGALVALLASILSAHAPMLRSAFAVFIGGGGVLYSLWSLIQGIASSHWPTTEGKILWSTVIGRLYGGAHWRWGWQSHITYSYRVAGITYTSRRIYFGFRFNETLRSKVQSLVARYPTSGRVHVHYDSSHPSRSVLEPGANIGATLFYACVCALILSGGLLL